ncbi:MAG TPA: hypothetical protein VF980_05375 [Thermoanaerobaculia bacterium]
MNSRYKILAGAAIALLLLAACGSSGNGGLGGIFGGGNQTAQLRGTVDSVDLNNHTLYLINVSGNNTSMLSSGGNSARVRWDNQTTVNYQNRTYRPEDLERGDQIDVTAQQNGSDVVASSINVLSDVRTSGGYPSGSYPSSPSTNYPSNGSYGTIHGVVRSVDTHNRTITIDRGYGSSMAIDYNTNTPVYYNGRSFMPGDLEVGDEIDVRTQNMNGSRTLAQDITVTRSVSNTNGTSGTTTNAGTIRGTVNSVDTSRQTIQLNSVSSVGFNRNAGSIGNTVTVSYDPNMNVNVNGQMYAVSGLERGDLVDIQVDNLGNGNYVARSINLVQDVRSR